MAAEHSLQEPVTCRSVYVVQRLGWAPGSMDPAVARSAPSSHEMPCSLFVLGLAVLGAVQAELHQCRHRRDLQLRQTNKIN